MAGVVSTGAGFELPCTKAVGVGFLGGAVVVAGPGRCVG